MNFRDKFNDVKNRLQGNADDRHQDEETAKDQGEEYDEYEEASAWEEADAKEREQEAEAEGEAYGEYENLNNRKYSRSSRNHQSEPASPITKALIFLLLLIIIIPLAITVYSMSRNKVPEPESADKVMVSKTQNISAKKAEEESREKELAKKESEESKKEAEESKREASRESAKRASESAAESAKLAGQRQEAADQAERESLQQNQGNTSRPAEGAQGTYTVQAGDSLYRIALNHGMSLDQLLQLNGLSAGSYIAPGMVLRVQ